MIRPIRIANDVYSGVRKVVRPIRGHKDLLVSRQSSAFYRLLQILSRTSTKSSTRQSQRSNRSGSHMSSSSSLSITRAKEAARIAELKAEAAAFKKR